MYTAQEVANYIVTKCIKDDVPVTNYQLQQMLYSIEKIYERTNNKRFFADDFEKRAFGYIIPNVYYRFAGYGIMPITTPLISIKKYP